MKERRREGGEREEGERFSEGRRRGNIPLLKNMIEATIRMTKTGLLPLRLMRNGRDAGDASLPSFGLA